MATFAEIAPELERQWIELPSWAFGNSGTRFKVFAQPGVHRDPEEKISDAAEVHLLTGLAPSVALHIPWDRVDDFDKLARHAEDLGVRLGTINTNTFQDDDYKLGSLTHVDERVRAKAVAHMLECIDIMNVAGAATSRSGCPTARTTPGRATSGTGRNGWPSPWPRSTATWDTTSASSSSTSSSNPRSTPPTSRTGGPAYVAVRRAGRAGRRLPRHRAPRAGTNIEFIVAQLLRLGRLGSFDFNSRFYADDDLIVGAADPFQLFRILFEVVRGGGSDDSSERRVHARPVPQHRGEDPRADPLGAQRAGDDGAGAPGRPRPLCSRPSGTATCSGRTRSSWTPSTPTSAPIWPSGGAGRGLPDDPLAAYREPAGTASGSSPNASAGPR